MTVYQFPDGSRLTVVAEKPPDSRKETAAETLAELLRAMAERFQKPRRGQR